MGIDSDLVIGDLEKEFQCAICHDILENPKEIKNCEHIFCNGCIEEWLKEKDQKKFYKNFRNQATFPD